MDSSPSEDIPTVTLVIPPPQQTVIVRANDSRNIETIEEESSNGDSPSETTTSSATYRPSYTGAIPNRTRRTEPLQPILIHRGAPDHYDDQNNPPNTGEVQPNQTSLFLNRPQGTNTGQRIYNRHNPPNYPNNAVPPNVVRLPTPASPRSSTRHLPREPRLPPNSRAGSPTFLNPTEDHIDLQPIQSPVHGGQHIPDLKDLPPLRHTHALNRHVEMHACNIDAEFIRGKLSIRLEANQPHTRVDFIRDDKLGVITHFWFTDPYDVEYIAPE